MATDEQHKETLHALSKIENLLRGMQDDLRWFRNRIERVDDMHRNMAADVRSALRFGAR